MTDVRDAPSTNRRVVEAARRTLSTRRRAVIVAAVAVAAPAVLASALSATSAGGGPDRGAPAGPPATAEVVSTTLTQVETVDGTLSHGVPEGLTVHGGSGIVTWLAPEGSVVGLGDPVYAVNGSPVPLVHGTVPPYRTLEPGVTGDDVAQLESALSDLGYDGFTADAAYDEATAGAVERWQADLGVPRTGAVKPGDIAVAPDDIRIALHSMEVGHALGAEANQTVLTYSGTTRVVTVALDVARQHLVAEGDAATVTLPGGEEVPGTVSSVGEVATTPGGSQGSSGGSGPPADAPPTIDVLVELDGGEAAADLTAAPVSVQLVTDTVEDVLAVPVGALVALADGGHGVKVVDGGEVTYVAVETGLFADGMVEVSGDGVGAGTVVAVPT